jgi:hypothetical protein
MQTGLYKVNFKTPLGLGAGVVVLENGMIRGGDSSMFYRGTYRGGAGADSLDAAFSKAAISRSIESIRWSILDCA